MDFFTDASGQDAMSYGFGMMISVDELDLPSGTQPTCSACKAPLQDFAYYDGDQKFYCEACLKAEVARLKVDAKEYAERECKIACRLRRYDPEQEYRCTPEEYAMGQRESYTENAYQCDLRHNCTNYDELIKGLSRDYLPDQVLYDEIHHRIQLMLEEAYVSGAYFEEEDIAN